jgi:AcrR family transcriptional regulator
VTDARSAQLPRGRHHLSRDDVVGAQRARILQALAETMSERGYVGTPVAAILERAGVSRETFYQQFSSKPDCFIAALEDTIARLGRTLSAALDPGGAPLATFDRLLAAYLNALADDPATARLFLIETYAAGLDVMRRRLELQTQFVDGIADVFGVADAAGRFACEALVGAVISMVTSRFVANDVARLDALRAPLVELAGRLLTPRAE